MRYEIPIEGALLDKLSEQLFWARKSRRLARHGSTNPGKGAGFAPLRVRAMKRAGERWVL